MPPRNILDYNSLQYGTTVLHPLALVATLIGALLFFNLPKRKALIPLVFLSLLIPMQQRLVVATLDFTMLRLLILCGIIRIVFQLKPGELRFGRADKLVVAWAAAGALIYTLQHLSGGALVNRLGKSFDALGLYFLARYFVRDLDDVVCVIKTLAVVSLVLAGAMLVEQTMQRNLFVIFQGLPEETLLRAGRLRCQGTFKHPILAGTFGSVVTPLFMGLWFSRPRQRLLAGAAIVAGVIIVQLSASSGPLLALLVGIIAMFSWWIRQYLRDLRWGVALGLLVLHLVMKAPVWALLWRLTVVGGSTGYHRYFLIDQFIRNFNQWWLLGTKTTAFWGRTLFDVTNQYVRVGVDGGLLTLVLFILLISTCFGYVGQSVSRSSFSLPSKVLIWSLGASLACHAISFIAISYFDQMILPWYLTLGITASISQYRPQPEVLKVSEPSWTSTSSQITNPENCRA
jgi:hypothetical protein